MWVIAEILQIQKPGRPDGTGLRGLVYGSQRPSRAGALRAYCFGGLSGAAGAAAAGAAPLSAGAAGAAASAAGAAGAAAGAAVSWLLLQAESTSAAAKALRMSFVFIDYPQILKNQAVQTSLSRDRNRGRGFYKVRRPI
jgi:hypothetical protein